MVKNDSEFVCSNCQYVSGKWQGRCPGCGEWNSFKERSLNVGKIKLSGAKPLEVTMLSKLTPWQQERISTGSLEFDQVLGGGLVPGSLVLLGGDPGVGKSTLALQTAVNMKSSGNSVLYVSGEESGQQIKLRADRLKATADLNILAETNLDLVIATILEQQPELVVIDSIQTMYSEQASGVVGGVSQIASATNSLMRVAKENHITIMLIGHVTKEGNLAGPKTLEHMVDTVLYLEGERFTSLRLLRCNKNRFGSSGEVGVFEMKGDGLEEVANPARLFLEEREEQFPGNCATAILEGNKVLLLEVESLVSQASFGYPRRTASGFDVNRLQLISAIIQKRLGVNLSNQDIYINVAGGFKLDERAADLPVAMAILSSLNDKVLPKEMLAFGEIGLSGELRGVANVDKRLKEAEKLGFTSVITGGREDKSLHSKYKKLEVRYLKHVKDLISIAGKGK